MKKILIFFIFVSLLIAIIVSLNSQPTILESSKDFKTVTTIPSQGEIAKNTSKVLAVMPQEYKRHEAAPIPWEEFNVRWLEELRTFITGLDPETGEKRFKAYESAKKKWDEFNQIHSRGTQKLVIHQRTREEGPVYSDKKAYEKLTQKWIKAYDAYKQQVRIIFGKHFEEVKNFNSEFEQSLQAYARDPEVPLGIEPAFSD